MNRVFYRDLILDVDSNVYEPREDSFLLADNLHFKKGEKVLEIGTGAGLISILAAKFGAKVVAIDINPFAVECARKNAELNGAKGIDFRVGDLFEPLKASITSDVNSTDGRKRKQKEAISSIKKFDLIVFNPPYLPREEKYTEKPIDLSYNSSEVLQKFLTEYKKFLKKGGRTVIVNSSISGVEVEGKILAEKKLAFEKLFVIELK